MKRVASVLLLLGLLFGGLALLHLGEEAFDLAMAEGDYRPVDERLSLYLEKFDILEYPSGRIRQYESTVVVNGHPDDGTQLARTKISVNHPLRKDGWWIYQFSYGRDSEGVLCTQFRCVKDPTLPFAVVGGVLLVLGALAFCFVRRPEEVVVSSSRVRQIVSWVAALAVVALPVFIIGRAVLRPDPMPALQSWLMAPHVAAYAASYLLLLFAAFGIGRRFAPFGFFLMTLGFVLGAVWGKIVWSEWWQYDPKECWSLATWTAFAIYLHTRPNTRLARVFLILGAVLIVLTLTWVNFSRLAAGLHSYA